ncbi:metallophosphoesterase family protein [Mucilaginibacter segetis]|uniref:Metallophosphoesterase n=1 Tax=Mucilaginibacter segetis TaxID=2793071 RepID=A0A934PS75_9SPHI|nr:metallophosphoesterase [Mucilaginibacter segetis]MBK0378507.1 metallophosphoesterase [Mucilaginibacter segetis]
MSKILKMKRFLFVCLWMAFSFSYAVGQQHAPIHILYTSDAHFGLSRQKFRGDTAVPAYRVNAAMIFAMNNIVNERLPRDNGVGAGELIKAVDYLIQTGDIANRQEPPYQPAGDSWQQFVSVYEHGLQLHGCKGMATQLLFVPGNHDISNAIGFTRKLVPEKDPTVMVKIYNAMMHPAVPLSNDTYDYANDKINYSRDIGGIHFVFITLWPDSAERVWMTGNLKKVPRTMPVVIFTHDQPTSEAKHFSDPLGPGTFRKGSKFENLTAEVYKEASVVQKGEHATDLEQRGLVRFLKLHPNIKAYFHGNSNWNEFYTYKGPNGDISLPVFRVDSPMKGKYSADDETKLSFQLISLDPVKKQLTVRECFWNTQPKQSKQKIVFGRCKSVNLLIN